MSSFQAAVLGAVQGLTEFVPISSSGHLVLVPEALGWASPGLAFDVLLHVASLIALIVYFRAELVAVITGAARREPGARRLGALLLIGTIPAGVAGLALGDYFEDSFKDADAAAVQLIVTAAILVIAELALAYHRRRVSEERLRGIDRLGVWDALLIGVAQAISILPGISRSGATIGAGLAVSMRRDDAARFAILLAIPALLGAAIVELPELRHVQLSYSAATFGFLASLITSYAAIAGLIRYLRTRTLYPFAAYCVVAGIAFLIFVPDRLVRIAG
ncbi:MAG TPA: undecaprenyl-diphosphate phosphatase [Actinomycetota bacterium]|nr:undecaprenyl-diphosphate phosphatase [Actinomycetota bacterium]